MSLPAITMATLWKGSLSLTMRVLSALPLLTMHLLGLPHTINEKQRVAIEQLGLGETDAAPEPRASTQDEAAHRYTMSISKQQRAHLLTLPLEIRLEIYSYLLLLPPYNSQQDISRDNARVHPALLATCIQIYAEAAPLLYSVNTWHAHFSLLTSLPRLRACYNPVTQPAPISQIRRWRLRVRLDIECPFTAEATTAAFTGMDELVLEVWQATFWGGAGIEVLERFEGVRGVRKVRILGSTTGFEGYLRWLSRAMIAPVGKEVEKYVAADDLEMKRLRGWT